MKYHNHHIIPKHMGGSDLPSNLQRVTIEQHAILHKELWEIHGKEQDLIAFKALSGQISVNEASIQAWKIGSKNGGLSNVINKTGIFSRTEEKIKLDNIKASNSQKNAFRNSKVQSELNKRAQSILKIKRQNSEWFNQVKDKISKANSGKTPSNKSEIYCIKCRKLSQYSRLLRSHKLCFKS